MTKNEVINTLSISNDGYDIILNENVVCEIDVFLDMFGDASLDYSELYNHSNADSGWKKYFDEWHNQELI